ncbi:MAG: NCS2 family permease, partial [Lachnospiraceae bacterium]|nr:NCS2 family permease [Lachnospiraceae bacterium]
LLIVGFLMFSNITKIKFEDKYLTTAIPVYLSVIAMPLFYSISEGICLGIISYVVLQAATGKAKKVTPLMYILAVLFVLKYVFL